MGIKAADLQVLVEVDLSYLTSFKVMRVNVGLLILRVGGQKALLELLSDNQFGASRESGYVSNVVKVGMRPDAMKISLERDMYTSIDRPE